MKNSKQGKNSADLQSMDFNSWSKKPKSPFMVGCFLTLWLVLVILFAPRLWQIFLTGQNTIEASLLAAFLGFHVIFWLLAAYFITTTGFSFISKAPPTPPSVPTEKLPPVALLYTTCNDFQLEGVESCLKQDYTNFHLFILDDSTQLFYQTQVEQFQKTNPQKITILRRKERRGFKPGALNDALANAAANYPFFAVIDADEILPTDFLKQTTPHLLSSNLGFVQANHAPNLQQQTLFARDISPSILPFWNIQCKARNRYGFVVFVGHGALVRRSAWESAGHFPEVISEDLAFSANLLVHGWRGIFLDKVVSHENFPASFDAFKRQQERYITGTTQVIKKNAGKILKSRKVSLIEKIDFLMWPSPLYIPALCLAFMILCGFCFAIVFGHWGALSISLFGHQLNSVPVRILDERFAPLRSWDFQFISVISAFSPAFASIALGIKRKLNAAKLLSLSTVPYLSLMVLSWKQILTYLITQKTSWPPTGDFSSSTQLNNLSLKGNKQNRLVHLQHLSLTKFVEVLLGVFLIFASAVSLNISFFAISCCLIIGALSSSIGWNRIFVRAASVSCFAIILIQMGISIGGSSLSIGITPLPFPIHF